MSVVTQTLGWLLGTQAKVPLGGADSGFDLGLGSPWEVWLCLPGPRPCRAQEGMLPVQHLQGCL